MITPTDGLVLIDKPAGPTSHDIVARIRHALSGIRVGHTGTLDPPATGLLVILLGRATRLARFLPREPKAYSGNFVLGVSTSTDDLTGEVIHRHEGALPADDAVAGAAEALVGRGPQVPPRVSAKRIAGRRLYALARRGQDVVPSPVEIEVGRFDVRKAAEPGTWHYELLVSEGTYVRACVRDLGLRLGCGAAVATLRRTSIGPWAIGDALAWPRDLASLQDAIAPRVVPLDELPLQLADVRVDDPDADRLFASGGAIRCPELGLPVGTEVAVRALSGSLLGVGEVDEGSVRPRVVLVHAGARMDGPGSL